jgi:hypothetical protein
VALDNRLKLSGEEGHRAVRDVLGRDKLMRDAIRMSRAIFLTLLPACGMF